MPDITQLSDEDLQKALGYKSGGDITKFSDDDLMKAVGPADDSAQMKDAQWGAQNPYLRAMQNTGNEAFVNPVVKSINALTPDVNGINKMNWPIIGPYKGADIPQIKGPDMSNAPTAAKWLGSGVAGLAEGAAAVPAGFGNIFAGYGNLATLRGVNNGDTGGKLAGDWMNGAAMSIPQALGGLAGSSLATVAAKPFMNAVSPLVKSLTNNASRIGTSLGMGTAGGVQAATGGGDIPEGIATGAAFGALSPMNPIGGPRTVSPEEHDALLDKGAGIYRNVLNPGKGIINKVEIKSGNDINDSMKLAAKEGLIINSNEGKLDNRGAIDQLKSSVSPLYDQQNQILSSNSIKQFNLNDLATQVKSNIAKNTNNAADMKTDQAKVQNEIDAEILRHGENVDGQTLNMIKQGMWGKSYNPLAPNANDSSRAIGFAAKDAIEKSYPLDAIKENNAKIGQYLQLQKVLEATHGQGIQGGKIGKYASQATGAITGGIVSSHLPLLGEVAGPLAGKEIGQRIHDVINDPSRITGNWAKNIKNVNINNPNPVEIKRPGVVTPEVMDSKQGSISMNPVVGRIGYDRVAAYGKKRNEENNTIITPPPESYKGGMPINQPSNPSALGLPNYGPEIRNPYEMPTGNAVSSNAIPMRGASMSATNPINVLPKTTAANGPLQPNLRAQVDMSKGGNSMIPEPMVTPPLGTPEHAQTFPQSQFNPLASVKQALGDVKSKLNSEKGALYIGGETASIGDKVRYQEPSGPTLEGEVKKINGNQLTIFNRNTNKSSTINSPLTTLVKGIKGLGNSPLATAIPIATALGATSVFQPSNSQAQTVKDPDRLKLTANQYIMKNEGWQGMPYMDTTGNKTVGYGFKEGGMAWKYVPDAVKQGRRAMTKQEGMLAFNKAYPDAVSSAHRFAGDAWDNLSINQQKALTDMSYQMGSLNGFPKLKSALQGGNYNTASREIMNSKYAKKDAPQRALQNTILMQS